MLPAALRALAAAGVAARQGGGGGAVARLASPAAVAGGAAPSSARASLLLLASEARGGVSAAPGVAAGLRAASGAAASTSAAGAAAAGLHRSAPPPRGFAAAAAAAQPAPADDEETGGTSGGAPPPAPPSSSSTIQQLPDVPPGSRRTGLVGVKAGMTHEWDPQTGARTALTAIWFDAPRIVQAKAGAGRDGYDALQVGAGVARRRRASLRGVGRAAGHAAAHGGGGGGEGGKDAPLPPPRWLHEFRITPDAALPPGTPLRADHFAVGQLVDVQGTTVGKGFTGVMKKWGFAGQGASHGNSKAHRKAGGIGACQDPGKVWKGKKMAGREGGVRRTALSLRVAGVDPERGLLFVAGAVPGGAGSPVRVSDAVLARHGGQPVARPFPTKVAG
jgi:large subunit ribosomal protein L3